jgi:Protein of unknown function (DUF998)
MDAVHLQSQGLPERTASGKPPPPHLLVVRPHVAEEGRSAETSGHPELSPPVRTFWLGWLQLVSLAGLSVFVAVILALHGLQPNLNPAEHTISEYSLGNYGWLMRAAFFVLGVGTLATAASLRISYGSSGWRRIGLLMLVAMAIGLFLDARFNTDHLRVPETFDGTIHSVGTWILALALPGAAFVLGSDFVRNSISKARLLLILAAAQVGAIVLFEVSPATLRGWAERLVTVLAVATLGCLQILSRRRARADGPQTVDHNDRGGPVFGLSPVSTSD